MASNAIMQDPSACLCMALPLRKSSSRRLLTPFAPHNWTPLLPCCFSEPKKKNASFSIITIKCGEPPMKPIWLDADLRQLTPTIAWLQPRLLRGWEEKLLAQRQAEEEAERFLQRPIFPTLAPELRQQLEQIGPALPALWTSGKISNEHKKRVLRSLISRVIA